MAASSSSTSSPKRAVHDVFLSFRGEDTRHKFIDHLYDALHRQKGINTFRDDDNLPRGESISPALSLAIRESKAWIVVLSQNYANSRWCLDELVDILKCRDGSKRKLLYPVFYEVEPSDVRHQRGIFGKGFQELASRTEVANKVRKWKLALKEVADLKGSPFPSPTHGYESKFIQELASEIFSHIKSELSISTKGLVGIGSHVQRVIDLLQKGNDEVRIIGIWGMGGIGKSTIAQAVYDRVSHQFEGSSYLSNVRKNSVSSGDVVALQEKLIFDISSEKNNRVANACMGLSQITSITCHRRILIVLDDVDELMQIENLIGTKDSFGCGSRIIITTRDRHVLTQFDVNAEDIYEGKVLDHHDSTELFISKVFGKDNQNIGIQELVQRAVTYARGVPLALCVLGSHLKGRTKYQWESALNRLEERPEEKIMKVLRISYEGLDLPVQQIFLEIACCLKGEGKDRAMRLLNSYDLYPDIGIEVLVDKSLISISNGDQPEIYMHALIAELGRDIVRQEAKDPGERSRLWNAKDLKHVLIENMGTKAVKSIALETHECLVLGEKSFAKMTELRFLRIRSVVELPFGLQSISSELRYLEWYRFPLLYLDLSSPTVHPQHLVELHMTESSLVHLWEEEVLLENLKIMDLSFSRNLIKTPNLKGVRNLEKLSFRGCQSLVEVHPSVAVLGKLVDLDFSSCESLRSFTPMSTGFNSSDLFSFGNMNSLSNLFLNETQIIELPKFIEICGNLKCLHVSGSQNLRYLPENLGNLSCLKEIQLRHTGIPEIPNSIAHLGNLEVLCLTGCTYLRSLPENLGELCHLQNLGVGACNLLYVPASLCRLSLLQALDLSRNNFECLPGNMNRLSNLISLDLSGCTWLQELPEFTPGLKNLDVGDCLSLRIISSSSIYKFFCKFCFQNCGKLAEDLEENILGPFLKDQLEGCSVGQERSSFEIRYPGTEIPKWFDNINLNGSCISFLLPEYWYELGVVGVAYCAVLDVIPFSELHNLCIHLNGDSVAGRDWGFWGRNCKTNSRTIWIIYLRFSSLSAAAKYGYNEIFVGDSELNVKSCLIKKCGLRLVYEKKKRGFLTCDSEKEIGGMAYSDIMDVASMNRKKTKL